MQSVITCRDRHCVRVCVSSSLTLYKRLHWRRRRRCRASPRCSAAASASASSSWVGGRRRPASLSQRSLASSDAAIAPLQAVFSRRMPVDVAASVVRFHPITDSRSKLIIVFFNPDEILLLKGSHESSPTSSSASTPPETAQHPPKYFQSSVAAAIGVAGRAAEERPTQLRPTSQHHDRVV